MPSLIIKTLNLSKFANGFGRKRNPDADDLKALLEFTTEIFKEEEINVMLIGGLAYGHHVEPRATQDLDFLILGNDVSKALGALEDAGLVDPKGGSIGGIPGWQAHSIFTPNERTRVDFIVTPRKFFTESARRAILDRSTGLYIIPIEAMIVLKYAAAKDRLRSNDEHVAMKGERDRLDLRELRAKPHNRRLVAELAELAGVDISGEI